MPSLHNLRIAKRQIATLLLLCLFLFAVGSVAGAQTGATTSESRDRGIQFYKQHDFKPATKLLSEAVKKSKEDGEAWFYLGLAQLHGGDPKKARKSLERAVSLRPAFVPAHAALANSLLFTNKVGEAEVEARQALTLEPQNADANYIVGLIRLRKRSCKEAIENADVAIKSAPNFGAAYLLRSQSELCSFTSPSSIPGPFGAVSKELSREDKLANARRTGERFGRVANDLETFLKLEPNAEDAATWRQQLEALRAYSQLAEKDDDKRTIFVGWEVTTKARILAKPEPVYTEAARQAQIAGTVVLRAVFAADGTVQHILVLSSLPKGLTEQAIKAARRIKFVPAMISGRPVSMVFQLEYNFNLY